MSTNRRQALALHDAQGDAYEPATLGGVLQSVWQYRVLVVVITLLSAGVAYAASLLQDDVYRAETRVFLTDPLASASADSGRSRIDPEVYTIQQVTRVTAMPVLQRASRQLNGRWSARELEEMVTVEPEAEALVLAVGANAPTPEGSTEIVRAVTDAYGAFNEQTATRRAEAALAELNQSQQQLQNEVTEAQAALSQTPNDPLAQARVETLTEQLLSAENSARALAIEAAESGSGVDFVEQVEAAQEPIQPKPVRNAALGGAVGFVLASALADVLARRRRQVDPSTLLGAPLLANIPDFRSAHTTDSSRIFDGEAAEAYQFLLASFENAIEQMQARSILITSASPGEGKSVTALHLARALAMQGREVMLVDADIRAHGLTSLLNADGLPGLVSVAEGEHLASAVRHYRISDTVRLRLLPAGRTPQNPTGMLATGQFRRTIDRVIAANELTIIDGGPLLTVADASTLATHVSGILLVIDADTPDRDLLDVQRRLRLIPTPLVGYVVNRSPQVSVAPYPYVEQPSRVRRLFGRGTVPSSRASEDGDRNAQQPQNAAKS